MSSPNTQPIWTRTPNISADGGTTMAAVITAAANDLTGASSNNALVFTAGTNGSLLERLLFRAKGTNVTTLARIYLNNGSANTTAANNELIDEIQLPATTVSTSVLMPKPEWYYNRMVKAGFRIYVGLSVVVASGWQTTPLAGDY